MNPSTTNSKNSTDFTDAIRFDEEALSQSTLRYFFETRKRQKTKKRTKENVISPTDNIPVAVLVKRGKCSFEEKAKNALSLLPSHVVKYIIIYDDKKGRRLVPMSANESGNVDVGLVFVSLATGNELLRLIDEQSSTTRESGGFKMYIDSESQWGNSIYDDSREWMIATMSGCIMFIFCCCCSLICVQAGFVHVENGFIFVGSVPPEGWNPMGNNLSGGRLMTTEEVGLLPIASYEVRCSKRGEVKKLSRNQKSTEVGKTVGGGTEEPAEFNNHTCAICLEDFLPGESLIILPCKHSFHSNCITPWLTERSSTCPLCKRVLLNDDDDEDENADDERNGSSETASASTSLRHMEEQNETTISDSSSSSINALVGRVPWRRMFAFFSTNSSVETQVAVAGENANSNRLSEPLINNQ